MSRLIPNGERLKKASELIRQARDVPTGSNGAFLDLSYVAQVKDLLRQARDLVKFISFSPSADAETKQKTRDLIRDLEETEKVLLRRKG